MQNYKKLILKIALALFLFFSVSTAYVFHKTFTLNMATMGNKTPTIGILVGETMLGEMDRAYKTQLAAKNSNINSYIYKIPKKKKKVLNFFANKLHLILSHFLKPDAVWVVAPRTKTNFPYTTPLGIIEAMDISDRIDIGENVQADKASSYTNNLITNLSSPHLYMNATPDKKWLQQIANNINPNKPDILPGYTSVQKSNLITTQIKGVFYCGANWDKERSSSEYNMLFEKINDYFPLEIYGPPSSWKEHLNFYKGFLPFDGNAVQKKTADLGITLVVHSKHHLDHGTPTGRVFDAASVGGVIICDEHPFVKKHFGDTVYYINTRQPIDKVIKDMDAILSSIKNNPQQALDKGRKAREIFEHSFTLEKQLQAILATAEKRKKNQLPPHNALKK